VDHLHNPINRIQFCLGFALERKQISIAQIQNLFSDVYEMHALVLVKVRREFALFRHACGGSISMIQERSTASCKSIGLPVNPYETTWLKKRNRVFEKEKQVFEKEQHHVPNFIWPGDCRKGLELFGGKWLGGFTPTVKIRNRFPGAHASIRLIKKKKEKIRGDTVPEMPLLPCDSVNAQGHDLRAVLLGLDNDTAARGSSAPWHNAPVHAMRENCISTPRIDSP
jgi:hypothetical protein